MTEGNGDKQKRTVREVVEALGEVMLAEAIESNLDKVMADALDMFVAEHKDEWNAYVRDTVIPALERRATIESADLEAKVLTGKAGGATTDEERTATIASIRSQKATLMSHAYEHLSLDDEHVARAKELWDRWFSPERINARFMNAPKSDKP